MTVWQTLVYGVLMMLGSAMVNLLIAMYFFTWKKHPVETEKEILRRDQHDRMWRQYVREHKINGG